MMQVSTRQTGMGETVNGASQNADDVTTYISNDGGLDTAGVVTYTRSGSTNDNRIAWQILEYIGPAGGLNEMKVLDTGVCNFDGGTEEDDCTGAVISGGAADDNDVAVIITGVSSNSAATNDYKSSLVTTEWKGASNVPVFNRTATNGDTVNVSYAVVEFTGSSWNLQRVERSGSDSPNPSTKIITDVGDLSRAFILQAQQRNADTIENVCETGEQVWLSDTTTLSFKHEFGSDACTFNSNMKQVVWILLNTNSGIGKKMIVEHAQPVDQLTTGGGEEDNWTQSISSLTYGIDESAIFGFTANSDGSGTTHPHGTIVADLTSSTTVNFWQSQDDEEQGYSFSVVQWPRSKTITIEFDEDLLLLDDAAVNLRLSFTESLSLDDGIVESHKMALISLIETLPLQDTINKSISITFTESLLLQDAINKNIPVILIESLVFDDAVSKTFNVSLDESLPLDDGTVESEEIIIISLIESLSLDDSIDRNITVAFTESLILNDVFEITHAATVSLDESLEFNDIVKTIHDANVSIIESLTFSDSVTQLRNIGENQVLVEDEQPSIAITENNQELVILSSEAKLDSIPICANDNSGIENTVMNYTALLTGTNVTITNGWTAEACIDDSNTKFDVEVKVANSTTITGPAGWNGIFELQTLTTITIPDIVTESETEITTETFDDITVIELGIGAQDLTFDEPVRLEFIGDGGNKSYKPFFKTATGSLTFITTCNADDSATVKAQLGGTGECSIDDGSDLIVYTMHATSFGDGRSRSTSSSTSSGSSGGGGGGGGGSSGAGVSAGAGGFGGILGTPLTINEISYDKCSENMARILVSSDADVPPTVKVSTAKSGVVFATLAEIQPYEELNKFSTVDRYLYELPISSDESFMMVSVTEKVGSTSHTVQASVKLLLYEGTTVVVPLPDDVTPEAETAARIFDTKIQIGNGTTYDAKSESEFLFISGQDLIVSAIIDSETPLQRVELRSITMGQTDSEYIGIKMDVTPLYVSNSTYVVSGTIPSFFMAEPGMTYWLHITDENAAQTASTHYNIGVKPTSVSDIEIEVDMPTIRPSGSIVQPEFYLFNEDEPSYGIVSLVVDGEVVSKRSQLFGTGQTQIIFNWNTPKSDGYVEYDIQGVVELYDSKVSTAFSILATHPKTVTVSADEMPALQVIQRDDTILADPALVYASNTDSELRFTVTDPQGQCIIGGADECLVNDSTRGKRGGLESVPYGDQILRVRYSGADNALERFSITSIDPIVGQWSVSLETEDGFAQQAHASEDVDVKIKYRYHSETITAFS